jgi:hypothetical protein
MELSIKDINSFSGGYVVHYTITTRVGCCGFPTTRHSLYIKSKTKPTEKQALKSIENELKNKR